MNCKPGDLVRHIGGTLGSKSPNLGKIFRVVRLSDYLNTSSGPVWETDGTLIASPDGWAPFADDEFLRPIRDNDGEDEILRIAGRPIKEVA